MKSFLVRSLLVALVAPAIGFAAPTPKPSPASDSPLPAPTRPSSTRSYWSTATAKKLKDGSVFVADPVGKNDLTFPDWLKLEPNIGFTLTGDQPAPLRSAARELITANILIGVDLKPATTSNVEYQTFIYLYGYCELRYRSSKGEISFNIWQGGKTAASVSVPLVPGKWNRVKAQIDGTVVRLDVNGVVNEATVGTDWSGPRADAPVLIGSSGADRPYIGSFNHLYIAEKP